MNVLFVVNPVAGDTDKEGFLEEAAELCRYFGVGCQFFETQGSNDKQRLVDQIDSYRPDRLLAVGGDGTFRLAATVRPGSEIPVGIIPMGSANGMARELGVRREPMNALRDFLLSRYIAGLDLLEVNETHYCLHIGDVGVNARLVQAYERDGRRGMVTYARYFLEELRNAEDFRFRLETDEETLEGTAVMLGICNGRRFGTSIPINLKSNPFDGEFEIVVIEEIDYATLLRAGLSVFDQKFLENQTSRVLPMYSAALHFEQPRLLQLDGEVIGEFEELNIRIHADAIPLVTHSGNTYLK